MKKRLSARASNTSTIAGINSTIGTRSKPACQLAQAKLRTGDRSVIQDRLKLPGAWWLEENARKTLAMPVTHANGEWRTYWSRRSQGID